MEIGKALATQDTGEEPPAVYVPPLYVTRNPLKEDNVAPSDTVGERVGPESPGEGSLEQARVAPPGISPGRPPDAAPEGFVWPLINRITSRFGPRGRRMHTGVDIAAPSYHEVVAAGDGEVIYVQHSRRGLGNAVVLQHDDGYRTVYGHGVVILVQEGDTVKRGQAIMGVGNSGHSTGSHLHFEIRKNGAPLNPIPLMPPTLDQLIDDLRADRNLEGPS
jgi:murein DD-endopeptidase MepM/ murein hydrolase activator NlpD